jgi:hypothetical protein
LPKQSYAVADIAASAQEQATGLQQVNTAVNQMAALRGQAPKMNGGQPPRSAPVQVEGCFLGSSLR